MSRNKFIGFSARVLLCCAAGLQLLSCISVFVNPAKAWLLVPLEILFWPLALLNAGLLVWALLRRSRAVVIPLVALIPCFAVAGRFVQFSGRAEGRDGAEGRGGGISIVSYNVGRFRSGAEHYGKGRGCRDSLFNYLRRSNADIICLQEFYLPYSGGTVKELMSREFRGYHVTSWTYAGKRGRFGNVTLSRFRPVNKGHIEFENSGNLALWSDYETGGRRIRVYNCHLESYNMSAAGIAKALSGRDGEFEDAGRKVRGSIRRRAAQVDQVVKDIYASPVESIVCGDFNDTPLSYTYQKMQRGHTDSFRDAGRGIGASFPSGLPQLRLDYVFVPQSMEATAYDCPGVRYSDHRPVIIECHLD